MHMNVRTTGFTLRAGRVAGALALAAGVLWMGSLVGQILKHQFGVQHSFGLIMQLDVDGETNIAAWFASGLLLLCAIVLWVISRQESSRRESRLWLGLAIIFMLLSMDEASELHELTMNTLRQHLYTDGYLYYPWVMLAVPFTLVVFLVYIPFLRRLRAPTRNLFLISGALYVGGAVGVEMVGAKYASLYRPYDYTFAMIAHVEEGLELAGSVLFLYALLEFLGARTAPLVVQVQPGAQAAGMTEVPLPADLGGAPAHDLPREPAPRSATPAPQHDTRTEVHSGG